MQTYDFVIAGSGIAGLSFALKAAQHGSVAVITKRQVAESNTRYAQGGIASVTSVEDSIDLHVKDTLEAGAGLCQEPVVRQIVSEGPERIAELIEWGAQFDKRRDIENSDELDLTKEGGHSKRRILHAQDATGQEIEQTLVRNARENPNITLLPHHTAIDLITTAKLGFTAENRVVGLYALDNQTGQVETFRSDRILLATGGCGKVYLYTTNPDVASGDGVAMAWRAGCTIANMEFVQFHPTCLYHPEAKSFLISEAVRGEGGRLIDERGQRFMPKYHERAELAPRDIVARAIDAEMKRTGARSAFLDITHKPKDFITSHFPTIHQTCLRYGIDITQEPIPVVPAAHYQCGGIRTDVNGFTGIRGLYAVGEVACTGLHGANRLASNSLLEALVVGHRAYQALLGDLPVTNGRGTHREITLPEWESGDRHDVDEMVVIYHNWDEIRRCMWDYVGIVRTDRRLERASQRLRNLSREIHDFYWDFRVNADLLELRNLVCTASLIVDCALSRKESRGLHYTLDYPEPNDRFRSDTILRGF